MISYALYHCCKKRPGMMYQRDRDRARLLLVVAACAFYVSVLTAYL